ncbi:MAG: hypothetical protein V1897_12535 [Pseudomonadota bacterium]
MMSKKIKNNFIDLCLRGEKLLEEIDDWVDDWHDSEQEQEQELHEYLGMSWAEYSSWVNMPEILPFIVTAHKDNKSFTEFFGNFSSLPMAARADSKLKAQKLAKWLKAKNLE